MQPEIFVGKIPTVKIDRRRMERPLALIEIKELLTSLSLSLELSASLGATDDVVSRSDALPLSSDVPGSFAIVSEFCKRKTNKKNIKITIPTEKKTHEKCFDSMDKLCVRSHQIDLVCSTDKQKLLLQQDTSGGDGSGSIFTT